MKSSFLRSSYLIFASPSIFFWAKLFCGTVPPNNTLFGRTVPPNSKLFGGTLDSEKLKFSHFMNLPATWLVIPDPGCTLLLSCPVKFSKSELLEGLAMVSGGPATICPLVSCPPSAFLDVVFIRKDIFGCFSPCSVFIDSTLHRQMYFFFSSLVFFPSAPVVVIHLGSNTFFAPLPWMLHVPSLS